MHGAWPTTRSARSLGTSLMVLAYLLSACGHVSRPPEPDPSICRCHADAICAVARRSRKSHCIPVEDGVPPSCEQGVREAGGQGCREGVAGPYLVADEGVQSCDACAPDEYCMTGGAYTPFAGVVRCHAMPFACVREPSCACLKRRQRIDGYSGCEDRLGPVHVQAAGP